MKYHICFKNWDVEEFNYSQEVQEVRYLKVIGNGYFSVYCQIGEKVSYRTAIHKIV